MIETESKGNGVRAMATVHDDSGFVRRLLWPRTLNPENTYVVRAGRMLHGAGIAGFVFFVLVSLAANTDGETAGFVLTAVGAALLGRGLRYVLADE